MSQDERDSRGILAVNLGLVANILLAALKTTFGIIGHSPALLADGVNSTSDVAYFVVVAVFMRLARKPADPEHPYGHRQLESIAALVVGAFVITTAVAIFWDAVNSVFDMLVAGVSTPGAALVTLWVALLTIALKIGLTYVTRSIGRQTGNAAVQALAYDHRNDIFSASAAAAGILLARLGYAWFDPLAGALVALVILRTGIEIIRESSADLMDTVPGRPLENQIIEVAHRVQGVRQIDEVKVHRFGPYFVVNLTVGVEGSLSVSEGDSIATQLERLLTRDIDFLRRVHVHFHPART